MKKYTTEEFIKKAREIHGDKYDYSKVEYVSYHTKVCIRIVCVVAATIPNGGCRTYCSRR